MENKLEKKYGLFTAICMVVGIVIGSGVFFKAQTVLQKTEGNMPLGILAWIIGGVIMLICILAFSAMAQKYEKVNGIIDYAEATVSRKYGYYIGWFMTTVYSPTLTSVLAWLSARYTLVFITSCWPDFPLVIPASEGGCVIGPECLALMLFFLVCAYVVNSLSPKLAGEFQTTTTVIKLIPLFLMAVVGIIAGLVSPTHMLASNFATASAGGRIGAPLLSAVCATSFAYEGWIIATSINAELKDSKRNLPRALVIGGLVIIVTYIAYYVGVAGGATVDVLMNDGATTAFTNIFGGVLGNILNLFIAISCMGTMNGLMLGCCRGMYSLAARGEGPKPGLFGQVDRVSNMPTNSAIIGLLFCAIWGVYFYLSNLAGTWSGTIAFKGTAFESVPFMFDSSELPIITIYAMYLPIFIQWMRKAKGESTLRRYIIPSLAVAGSLFMVYACLVGHRMENFWYLIVFAVIMFLGYLFRRKDAGDIKTE
ncbi:MAG: APC family permease [Candidatus Limivicinus sp.]|nr:APC family permease [Clostridiales bacterium]MDY3859530.1 APC family permease [Candidatus Limivicinus sp.]